MNPDSVREQIRDLIDRLLIASISVKQFSPAIRTVADGAIQIGGRSGTAIAMRDIPYEDIYRDLDSHDAYHVKLIDGGLLLFQYCFRSDRSLEQHRLAYFPSPVLPTVEEAPALYEQDELYGDITARRLVRFPVRFDYAPDQKVDVLHPASHMTLGQYEGCRIPVAGPLGPSSFGMFIIRNFYFRAYKKFKNNFDRRPLAIGRIESISDTERRVTHVVHGL
jgi:hypothetical protein